MGYIVEIGNYDSMIEIKKDQLSITVTTEDCKNHWHRCSLLADFAANYFSAFFPVNININNAFSTIINELIENAVKYSEPSNSPIELRLFNFDDKTIITCFNTIDKVRYEKFKNYVEELVKCNEIDKLYKDTLESKALTETSGLGLISIINYYNSKLGFKFKESANGNSYMVLVQVLLNVNNIV
jgi:hypothetical protein